MNFANAFYNAASKTGKVLMTAVDGISGAHMLKSRGAEEKHLDTIRGLFLVASVPMCLLGSMKTLAETRDLALTGQVMAICIPVTVGLSALLTNAICLFCAGGHDQDQKQKAKAAETKPNP